MSPERKVHPFKEIFAGVKVSIDIDGVSVISGVPVIAKVNNDFNGSYKLTDINYYMAVRDIVAKEYEKKGMPKEVALRAATKYDREIWTSGPVLARAPVARGAEAFIKRLHQAGVDYRFITSRIPNLANSTLRSMTKKFPFVDPSLIRINRNANVSGKEFKWREVGLGGVGLHIDDSEEHARLICENTFATVVLLSYPNASEQTFSHPRLIRLAYPDRQANLRDLHRAILFRGLLSYNVAQSTLPR